MMRWWRMVAPFLGAAAALPAAAQNYSVTSSQPDLGRIVPGRNDMVLRIDPASGEAVRMSGSGVRLATRAGQIDITIDCGFSVSCSLNWPRVTIAPAGTPRGRADNLSRLTVNEGTARIFGDTDRDGDRLIFTLYPIGLNNSKTFSLGYDFTVFGDQTGKPSGTSTAYLSMSVSRGLFSSPVTASLAVQASVLRTLSTSVVTNLSFGRIARPSSGSTLVTLDPNAGTVAFSSGGAVGLPGSTISAGVLQVVGEGGQGVSISVPSTVTLKNGAATLLITTTAINAGARTLSGLLGQEGSLTVKFGGKMTIVGGQTTGVYRGTAAVVLQYN